MAEEATVQSAPTQPQHTPITTRYSTWVRRELIVLIGLIVLTLLVWWGLVALNSRPAAAPP